MTPIKEEYVSYEVAKLLKERGFHEPCIATYNSTTKNFNIETIYYDWTTNWKDFISAPTQAMAMKWLREAHNIDIITSLQFNNSKWTYSSVIFKLSNLCSEWKLNDNNNKKEEAYENAIKFCLKNLI